MKPSLILILLVLLLLLSAVARAQSGGDGYSIDTYTVDGGGAADETSGGYGLSGTAGQPDAGALECGAYTLGGGFWPGGALAGSSHQVYLYLPLVLNGVP